MEWDFPARITHRSETPMFIGEYRHTMDEKGRISVPVKFRASLSDGAIVTRGLDRSLFLYPVSSWQLLAQKLAALPLGQEESRAFTRLMFAGAMDVALDASGRLLLPEYLRQYASIQKSVVFAGLYDRIELWDATLWDAHTRSLESRGNEIAERLAGLGV